MIGKVRMKDLELIIDDMAKVRLYRIIDGEPMPILNGHIKTWRQWKERFSKRDRKMIVDVIYSDFDADGAMNTFGIMIKK